MRRAIKTHMGDFIPLVVLVVLAIAVSAYVLSNERLRFPFFSSSQITMNLAIPTAQAFTPGQGQTVRVSGVQIGDVGNVTLKDGHAILQMKIDEKYKHLIRTDASALARPRTGLQDMFVELNPGTKSAPLAKPGFTIPLSNSLPEVNPDEVLSSLDADTRAYLDLLVNGAGQGLKKNGGNQLAQVFERFEPTHRDLARLNRAVAARGQNLQRLINSLQRLNTALAAKQAQIVQLVDSSAKVFRAFASENQNVSRAVADLPGTLQQTTITLGKVQTFANLLGPTARNLIPAVSEIPAANQAVTQLAIPGAPIVQNQIRPFVRAARPFVRNLRPAAVNLAAATPNLASAFDVLNHLGNMLGFSPGGKQHGYLWWLAWLNHSARTLFSIQDANGDFRPLYLQATCGTFAQFVNQVGGAQGVVAGLLLNFTQACSKLLGASDAANKQPQRAPSANAQPSAGAANGSAKSSPSAPAATKPTPSAPRTTNSTRGPSAATSSTSGSTNSTTTSPGSTTTGGTGGSAPYNSANSAISTLKLPK